MKLITCAFVNSDPPIPPISKKLIGVYAKLEPNYQVTINITAIYEVTYPHPNAPDDATIKIYEPKLVSSSKQGDITYPASYLFYQAQLILLREAQIEIGLE